jgi:hypothetical protein
MTIRIRIVAAACLVLLARTADAVIIEHGNFPGATVMYLAVTEDTHSSPVALFGRPDVNGDTLDFDPVNFQADTSVANPNLVDGQLTFTIMSNNNSTAINNVIIEERGDYTVVGNSAEVTFGLNVSSVKCTHVNGNSINPVQTGGQVGGMFTSPPTQTAQSWSGRLEFDIAQLLANNNIQGICTKVEVTLDNALTALATGAAAGRIEKKDFSGVTITIPEPSAAAMTLCVGVAVLGLRRFLA